MLLVKEIIRFDLKERRKNMYKYDKNEIENLFVSRETFKMVEFFFDMVLG